MSRFEIFEGDCRKWLRKLDAESVHCCVTSPPYFGLRDYGMDEQIGLEATPAEYVAELCSVFDEVWRVLRADGTVWLNLGSSYCSTRIESDEMVLREDLTPDERRYVLEELAKHAAQA